MKRSSTAACGRPQLRICTGGEQNLRDYDDYDDYDDDYDDYYDYGYDDDCHRDYEQNDHLDHFQMEFCDSKMERGGV